MMIIPYLINSIEILRKLKKILGNIPVRFGLKTGDAIISSDKEIYDSDILFPNELYKYDVHQFVALKCYICSYLDHVHS